MDAVSILSGFEKNRKLLLGLVFAVMSWQSYGQGCNCPPVASCKPCAGGLTSMTLRYNGALGLPALITVVEGGGALLYSGIVNSGGMFSFSGSMPNEKFVGDQVIVSITAIPNAIITTSCSTPVFVNSTFGSFTVLAATSKGGGTICCSPADTDTTPPQITNCPTTITAPANPSTCTTTVTWPLIGAADNCGSVSLSGTHNSGAIFPLGITTVTYTATDAYGNMAECEFDVEVIDETPPVFNGCPGKRTVSANGSCQAVVNWVVPTASDNCSSAMVISDHSPGETFPLGITTVTYTATDDAGNSSECSFDVEVIDNTPPAITGCPSNISRFANASCQAVATWTTPIATDNCSVTLTSDHVSGETFSLGTTKVTYTATDGAGIKTLCSFNVIVTDNTQPLISACPANISLFANSSCQAIATWVPPTATDNCSVSLASTHSPGSTFPIGTTKVTYTATDGSGNKASCSFNVIVTDNTKPVFTSFPANKQVSANASTCQSAATWTLPIATDNCSVVLTSNYSSGDIFPMGTTLVTYTATDGSGNATTRSFNVHVNDGSPPVFTCLTSDITVTADASCATTATWTPPTAVDCSSLTISKSHNPGDIFPIGTTQVTYKATDASGNSSTCSFNVVVEDNVPPFFILCQESDIIKNTDDCEVEVSWPIPTAKDNCGDVTVTSTHSPDDYFRAGTTEVVYTATDNYGNSSECRFNVIVTSSALPVIANCPDDIYAEADITAKVAITWTEPSVTSQCDVVFTSNFQPGDEFPVGTTVVKYTATDESGHEVVCSFNVVVEFGAPVFEVIQVVTPNGDGINDDWTITNLQYFSDNNVMVVDRWGSLIYRASGYNNENVVWKGVNSSGTTVPTGTYFYTIVVDWEGKHVEKRGFIEVVQ